MSDRYFSIAFGDHRALCISPLTDEELIAEGKDLNRRHGYYLYSRDDLADGVTILAEVGDEDAAIELNRILGSAGLNRESPTVMAT